jgi:GNAT superfamily N-acetyltransferase
MNIIDDNNIITIKKNNEYIGSIKYIIQDRILEIKVFYIINKYRGQNYGKILLDYIINKAKSININKIILDAKEYYSHYNKLINYYKKFNFDIDKEIPINQKWVDGELVRTIRMTQNLKSTEETN